MAISIDWDTRVISIPKTDTVLVQSVPTEVRELDLNVFRLALKSLEATAEGITYPDVHAHTQPVDIGGLTLARVVEIVNNYTLTFEDGQYAVNLIGANSNVGDNVNVNQVSIRSFNSAGLVTSAAIEFGEYEGAVTIDQRLTTSGTAYPRGTLRSPCGNIADALVIANSRGFATLRFINPTVTIDSGNDVSNKIIEGINPTLTTMTITGPAITTNCSIREATISGTLDGGTELRECVIGTLNYVNGTIVDCVIEGTITLGGSEEATFLRCFSGIPGQSTPEIDMGGSGQALSIRDYNGGIKLSNKTGSDNVSVDLNSGQVILDTDYGGTGQTVIRGVGKFTNNGTATNVDNELLSSFDILTLLRLNGNKVTRVGDVITIYEEDDITVWRKYDLAGGGRVITT